MNDTLITIEQQYMISLPAGFDLLVYGLVLNYSGG